MIRLCPRAEDSWLFFISPWTQCFHLQKEDAPSHLLVKTDDSALCWASTGQRWTIVSDRKFINENWPQIKIHTDMLIVFQLRLFLLRHLKFPVELSGFTTLYTAHWHWYYPLTWKLNIYMHLKMFQLTAGCFIHRGLLLSAINRPLKTLNKTFSY